MPEAQVVHQPGPPEVMRREECPVPDPAQGEVRNRHAAVGVSFADTCHRSGVSHPWRAPPCPGGGPPPEFRPRSGAGRLIP